VSEPNIPAGARFALGDRVRVVKGTADPDFPDISLDGWVGIVREVDAAEAGPLYLVEWTDQTLAAVPPGYRERCERDDLEFEQTWLREADLEADPGGPLTALQPTQVTSRPLNLEDPADRARHILGVSGDELPEVTEELLRRFHAHLQKEVRFPFMAGLNFGSLQPVMVMQLISVERCLEDGGKLRAVVEGQKDRLDVPLEVLEPIPGDPAAADLAAYREWVGQDEPAVASGPANHPLLKLGLLVILLAGLLGALLEGVPETRTPALVVACILGVLGGLAGGRYEMLFRNINRLPPNMLGGLVLGAALGAGLGALLGALLAVYVGSVAGAVVGTLLGQLLAAVGVRRPGTVALTFLGACAGGGLVAFLGEERDLALGGLWHGMVAGVAVVGLVVLGVMFYLMTMLGRRG
jgi:hypothetical protein